jgi:hypothetical protein
MSEKAWNWLIAVGALVAIVGLLFFPAALSGPARDEGLMGAGGAVLGTGALIIAMSLYFKASSIRNAIDANPQLAAMLAGKKLKASCDNCQQGASVILCSMHKKSLCGNCLAEHYDSRACVYVPAARRAAARNARAASATRG